MRRILTVITILVLVAVPALPAQTFRAETAAVQPMVGFGSAAAVSGDVLFVGRPGTLQGFPMPSVEAGGVHIYRKNAQGTWAESGMLTARGTVAGDGFGGALSVDGTWAAVAASRADGKGAVHLFERTAAGQWTWRAKLALADGAEGDRFGSAVAIMGDRLVVGAPGRDSSRGAVVVFRRAGGQWTESGRLMGSSAAPGDQFGMSVALLGEAMLVGAPGPTGGNPTQFRPGKVFSFARGTGGAWTEGGVLMGDSLARMFGARIAGAGQQAYVASPFGGPRGGAVFLFRRGAGGWSMAATITPDQPQTQSLFGASLAPDGHDLLVGAPLMGGGAGAVFVMRHDPATDGWSQAQQLTAQGVGFGMQLGMGLAAANGLAVAGAPLTDFFEGRGFVFRRGADGTWTEEASVAGDAPDAMPMVTGGEVRCADQMARAFNCTNVDLVAFIPKSALGAKRGIWVNDLWGWTDPQTDREYAIVGRIDGTTFVDVTDPANPRILGDLPLTPGAQPNLWRDMKVYKDHVFIVSDGAGPHGMQVFDLTRLRNVMNPPQTFTVDAHYDRIFSAHNIVIDTASGYAYTVGNSMGGETCGGALHIVDIRDPKKPTFAGCFGDPATGNARTGYTHDAQCVVYQGPDEAYRGRQICFNASETALGIADVTDKANPRAVSHAGYPNVAYTHQGWLSDDHKYFYINDEGDELGGTVPRTRTLVFDVQDLDDPVMVKEFLGNTAASDHNLYVKGRYMYQSNYVAGLRVIDITDPVNPVEVGFFDTVPFGENSPGFAGSWSNYPFFKSGAIAVTSVREGLFLLRFNPPTPVP